MNSSLELRQQLRVTRITPHHPISPIHVKAESRHNPVAGGAAPVTPCTASPQTSASLRADWSTHLPDQQTRRRRAPGRRFLAPSSDAVYTSTPPRRLESTSIADPGIVVELVGAAVSIRDEPECVSDAILDSYGRDAAYFQSVRHAAIVETAVEARASLPVESRLRDAWERAKKQHRQDLRGELLAVDKAVEKARRGQPARLVENADGFLVSEPRALVLPAAALGRLELVEAKLDRAPDLELLAA